MKKAVLLLVLFSALVCSGQNREIDSVIFALGSQPDDSNKVNSLNDLTRRLDVAGDYSRAIQYSTQCIQLSRQIQFRRGLAVALKNSGNVFFNQSNFPRALEYYLESLKVFEEIGDKQGIGRCYGSLGNVYQHMLDYSKSLEYYVKALELFRQLGNSQLIAILNNNIGEVYRKQLNYPKALEYYFKALEVFSELQDKHGKGNCYSNISVVYTDNGELKPGLEYCLKALEIRKEIGDKHGIGTSFNNLAEVLMKMGNYKLALHYCDSALTVNRQIDDVELLRTSYECIAEIHARTGLYKEAYENYVKFKHLTDTIFSVSNSKKIGDLRTAFEVEKKETELKMKAEAQQALANEEKKRQQFVIYLVAALLVCVVIFAGFMFNRYKMTKKQKHIIEEQKAIVEESQKQTIDSITYAKRIQEALLTSEKYIGNYLKEFFIVYKPKDIVSGDFYYAIKSNGKFYLATADCTGHGVPGALMSMLGISFLNEIIIEKNAGSPDRILNQLRDEIISSLNQEGSSAESTDGMDISLCSFDLESKILEYACANNGIYIVRNGELISLKPDKMPVGKHFGNIKPFTNYQFQLQAGDMIFTYTDGYTDQFGGERGKKFNSKQLEELLMHHSGKSMPEQKQLLTDTFNNWKGNLEQVDDICIIGIRI